MLTNAVAPQVLSTTSTNLAVEDYWMQTPDRRHGIQFNIMNKLNFNLYFTKKETLDDLIRIFRSSAGIDQNHEIRFFSGEQMLVSDPGEYHENIAKGMSVRLANHTGDISDYTRLFVLQKTSIDYKEKSPERQQLMEFQTQPPISIYLSGEETLDDLCYIVKHELQIPPTRDITILRDFSPLVSKPLQLEALVAQNKAGTLVKNVNELANRGAYFSVRQSPVDYEERSYDRHTSVRFNIKNKPKFYLFFNGRETMTDIANILRDASKVASNARIAIVAAGSSLVSDQENYDWQFAEGTTAKFVKNLRESSVDDAEFLIFEK